MTFITLLMLPRAATLFTLLLLAYFRCHYCWCHYADSFRLFYYAITPIIISFQPLRHLLLIADYYYAIFTRHIIAAAATTVDIYWYTFSSLYYYLRHYFHTIGHYLIFITLLIYWLTLIIIIHWADTLYYATWYYWLFSLFSLFIDDMAA